MSILSRLRAKLLPEQKPATKLPSRSVGVPRYLGTSRGAKIGNNSINTTSVDRALYARGAANVNDTVANLVRVSPDLAHAVSTKIATIISKRYNVVAYDEVGRIDIKGTEAAQALALRWDYRAPDYSRFTKTTDLRSVCSSMILDSVRYGGMTAELVLGAGKLPSFIRSVDTAKIDWADNLIDSYPIYKGKDGDVPLNFPTIFYSATQQDMSTPYSESPLQTAIQPALWDNELSDHLRRAVHKNLLQRLIVTIDSEEWLKTLPISVRNDKDKLKEYADSTIAQIEEQINGLSPEDSLVIFSTLGVGTTADKNRSEDRTIEVLNNLISGQLSSGSKILPSILGRSDSSSASSTEAMLFLNAAGFLQVELNIMLSRIFTLAVRLMGNDVSVKFEFDDINLRPEIELESFRSVKQARIAEQLSWGMISDVEASISLTGSLPPEGYKNLSGTMFKLNPVNTKENSYSNTSATADGKTDSSKTTKDVKADSAGVPGKNSK